MTPNLLTEKIRAYSRGQDLPPLHMLPRSASSSATMLAQYEQIAEITGSMMEAARQDDWNRVIEFGQQYGKAVETLPHYDTAIVLTDQERAAKRDLLIRILEYDAITRDLISPQLAWLGSLLGQLKRQRSLLHAYGGSGVHRP